MQTQLTVLGRLGATIPSATTTDLSVASGDYLIVSGTTTITGLGTAFAGFTVNVQFSGTLLLTYNATSLILPGGGSITTAAGDIATFRSLGAGNWICTAYLLGGAGFSPAANVPAYNPSGGATVTLTAAQNGQTFLLDAATGVTYTLPAPAIGLTYNFAVTVSVTSSAHEVKTNAGTVFLEGVIAQIGSATTFGFKADGTTILALKMNGTTTGGVLGSQFTFVCVSATEWLVSGINVASGTAATPFTNTP